MIEPGYCHAGKEIRNTKFRKIMKKLIFCHPRKILSLLQLPLVAFCLTANVAKGLSECYTPDGPGNGFAPSANCTDFIFGLPSSGCDNYINYAPLPFAPHHTAIKNIRLVFHVFRKDDGTDNFQNTPSHINLIDQVVAGVNGIYSNVEMINAASQGTACPPGWTYDHITDSRIRFTRHSEILFHDDSDYYAPTGGQSGVVSASCEAYDLYVKNNASISNELKENSIHIFLYNCQDNCSTCAPCANGLGGVSMGIPVEEEKCIGLWRWYFYGIEQPLWDFYDKASENFAHELGHALGLYHVNQDDCCDTNGNQTTSNDLMATNDPAKALTECQIARIHYLLEGKCGTGISCSDVHQAVITDYCTKNTAENITIHTGEQIVWETHRKLYSDVIVETGAQLTIKCTVGMPNGGNIFVRRGGRLIVDGGRITHNSNLWDRCADGKWAGIIVDGNPAGNPHSQAMQSPNYVMQPASDPGIVLAFNNAILEDATIAVSAFNINDFFNSNLWGGLIYCQNTTFRNNAMSAGFVPYKPKNWSGFETCIFIIEDGTPESRGVGMIGVRDIKLNNCTFKYHALWGIGSWDSSPKVTKCTLELNHHGIDAFAYRTLSSVLQIGSDDAAFGNTFKENSVGIYTGTINNLKILNNIFIANEFDASVNGEGQFVVKYNQFGGTLGLDMVNTLDKFKEAKCNYYDNFIGMDMSGDNFGLYFNQEEFSASYDVFLTNEGNIPGKVIDQGGDNNANWCYFTQGNIQQINTTGTTEHFFYYHPDPVLFPKTRPKCSLSNPLGCVAPNNFTNSQTFGYNPGCLENQPPGGEEPCITLPTIPCLDAVKNELTDVQNQISQGNNSPQKQRELRRLTLEKSRIFWEIINLYLSEENYAQAEQLLVLEGTTAAKRAMILLKSERGQYAEAQVLLNSFPTQQTDDQYFKTVQQINLNRWQQGGTFVLSTTDEAALNTIANSYYPSGVYAKGMVSEVKNRIFEPSMPIPPGERNAQGGEKSSVKWHLNVVPNPATERADIVLPQQVKVSENARLIIVDTRGSVVQSLRVIQDARSVTIDLSRYASGIYFAIFANGDEVPSQARFVVSH
jgi:hypothetical protein